MNTRNRFLAVITLAVVGLAAFAGQTHAVMVTTDLGILDTSGNNPATGAPWAPGDQYRLTFFSSERREAADTDIEVYNTWAQGLANATTAYDIGADEGVVWKVIGSTDEVDARDNTSTNPEEDGTGHAIFLLDGSTVVANDFNDLWDGEIQNIINITEKGNVETYWPFTGSYWDGTKAPGHGASFGALGNPSQVHQGRSDVTNQWVWRTWTGDPPSTLLNMYAMSDALTVYASADVDRDGDVDLVDIDALTGSADLPAGVPAALAGEKFDVTGDGTVNSADLDQFLADAATINGFGSPYLKGDANLDGDVDVWAFDGSGDAQVLSSNIGTMSGMVWSDGDFNGDGDVDVWAFDGSGDAQHLSSNLGSTNDAAAGTAEAIYNAITGELSFDVGEGVAVIGVQAEGMKHGNVDAGSPLGDPGQNAGNVLAYFNASGLTAGMASVGSVLPTGLTAGDIGFAYTPLGGATTVVPVTVIVPEPSTFAMLLVVGALALIRGRRRA